MEKMHFCRTFVSLHIRSQSNLRQSDLHPQVSIFILRTLRHTFNRHMKNWFIIYRDTFRAFSNFEGRSTRLEMWNFLINNIVIGTILILLIGPFAWIFNVVVFIASICLTVRRFHDVGLNGWFLIGLFIPILNLLFFAMLYFFKSDPGTNKYGPNPYGI